MNPSLGYVVAMSIAFSAVVMAQQTAMGEEEKQIRALIVAEDAQKAPPASEDRIFWSGAIKRPIVGRERGEEIPSDRQPANRVTGSQRTKTTVRRIEIAKSGDLAYEFSDVQLSFQLQNGSGSRICRMPRSPRAPSARIFGCDRVGELVRRRRH